MEYTTEADPLYVCIIACKRCQMELEHYIHYGKNCGRRESDNQRETNSCST